MAPLWSFCFPTFSKDIKKEEKTAQQTKHDATRHCPRVSEQGRNGAVLGRHAGQLRPCRGLSPGCRSSGFSREAGNPESNVTSPDI